MAFRTPTYWKSMLSRLRGSSSFTTSTSPKMKPHAPIADFIHVQDTTAPRPIEGEFVPVFVALGLILMSTTFGLYTATHQLMYAPNVRLRKSKRETLPELVEPDNVVHEADKFIKKSFFRKMAHIQEFEEYHMVTDPFSDIFTMPPRAETLKSVGVDLKL